MTITTPGLKVKVKVERSVVRVEVSKDGNAVGPTSILGRGQFVFCFGYESCDRCTLDDDYTMTKLSSIVKPEVAV